MIGLRKTTCALGIALGALLAWCAQGWSQGVLVVEGRDIGPFREAVGGLASVLDSAGVNVVYRGDEPNTRSDRAALLETIVSSDIELVVTVGTVATEEALACDLGTPLVFCMVLDPVDRGFVRDLEHPGGRITGVALDIPIEAQFKALKETVPRASRVGVLFSTPRNRQLVERASSIASRLGIRLVPAEIASEEAVPRVLRDLTTEIDALWGIADPVAFSSISTEHVILHTIRSGIPFMGLSASFVKAGALLALSCDYYDIGRQAGEKVLQVLSGQPAGDIPVSFPRATALHLSERTARLMGIKIPADVVRKAKEVRR